MGVNKSMPTKLNALFVLRDLESRVLIQHRDKHAPHNANKWGLFGGGIKNGESPKDAVIREAMEELGIELKDIRLYKKYTIPTVEGSAEVHEKYVFVGPLKYDIAELKRKQKEGDDLGLFSKEDLAELDLTPTAKIILYDLFRNS